MTYFIAAIMQIICVADCCRPGVCSPSPKACNKPYILLYPKKRDRESLTFDYLYSTQSLIHRGYYHTLDNIHFFHYSLDFRSNPDYDDCDHHDASRFADYCYFQT